MDVLITELADVYSLSGLPFVHWGLASSLLLPVPVEQMAPMTVRLLSHTYLLFVYAIVMALRVFVMVDAGHPVRVAARYQAVHSFFLEAIYKLQ